MTPATVTRNALLAAAYVAFGWAGLLLAVPPGYATGVWLPSGIALAAILRWGPRLWPGVWLGAFLLNAFHAGAGALAVPEPAQFGIAAALATGSVLQALAIGHLVGREPLALADGTPGSVLRFALLWTPAGCVIAASVAVGTLWSAGALGGESPAANWLTWWFGDWMGAVIATPAMLALLGSGSDGAALDRSGRRAMLAVGVLGFAFVTALHVAAVFQERARLASQFEVVASELAARVQRELEFGHLLPAVGEQSTGLQAAESTTAPRGEIEPGALVARMVEGRPEAGGVLLRVSDLSASPRVVLYERPLDGAALRGPPVAFSRQFDIGGRALEFEAVAGRAFVEAWGSSTPRLVQVAGLLVVAMLVCFALVLGGRDAQVRRLVTERTAALDERNTRLQAEMSARAAVEERLRETQRNFLDSLEFAQIGAWDFDVAAGVLSGTRQVSRLYGLPDEEFRMDIATAASLVHTGDRERFTDAVRRGIESNVETAIDYRIVRRDGQQRWVTSRSRRRIDPDGRVRVLGVTWDISDRVAAAARANLLVTAFDQGGEAIFIADADLGIIEVNSAFCALTGMDRAQAIGRDVYELFSGRTSREQFRSMVASARERGHWQGEVWGRAGEGGDSPQWLVLAAVRNDRGLLVNHVGSFVDISERKHAEERIEFLAHHDALTGLPNRFALHGRLEQALAQASRSEGQLAVMFIDMDRFKDINDSLGHDVGDLLLLEIAGRLRKCVRASDVVARLGGDEFVVVLTGVADAEAAASTAAKLRQELATPYPIRGRMLHSSPSIGISMYPEHGETADVLTRNADAAMYRAKESGRNNYQFFDLSLSERARERLELAEDLRTALQQRSFLLYYQTQVRASDGRIVAAEALIRWPHPTRGMVPPDKFIGIAEEFGLIDAIGEWALVEACRELAVLNALGVRDFRICVNLSPRQLRDPELPDKVAAAIAAAGIRAADLELELTESVAMQDPQSTIQLLNRLFASGVGLAIDDFGTGYSSLSYLKMLPLHNLKLDRTFVRDIELDSSDRAICSATVALAHALGIKVVAEGVETEAQRDFLLALGCDYLQGWLFSKAVPADQLAALLQASEKRV